MTYFSRYFLFIRRCTFTLAVISLVSNASVVAQEAKYWIFFTDKGDISKHRPENILSPKALQRRQNQNIELNYTDFPLNSTYVQEIQHKGGKLVHESKWLNAVSCYLTPEVKQNIEKLPFVKGVLLIKNMQALRVHESTQVAKFDAIYDYGGSFAQLAMNGIDAMHAAGFNGSGKTIAFFDDGFNGVDTISCFKHLFERNAILGYHDFVDNDNSVYRQGGHGTNCLSLLAGVHQGKLIGGAPGVQLYLLRTEQGGSETIVEEDNWVRAAEWADSVGVDIFQTSLGYSVFDNDKGNHSYADLTGDKTPITKAADLAASKGILVINSAGNSGMEEWRYVLAPADGDSVIAVGAVTTSKTRALFSSQGPTADGRIKPDVMAMGQSDFHANADGSISQGSGTSYAAPIMTGFASCLWQAFPKATAIEIFNAILQSADRYENPDTFYGFGIPNAIKAMEILSHKHAFISEAEKKGFSVGPNPAKDNVTVFINQVNEKKKYKLEIYDPTGKSLFQSPVIAKKDHTSFNYSREQLNIGEMPGLFILVLKEGTPGKEVYRQAIFFQQK